MLRFRVLGFPVHIHLSFLLLLVFFIYADWSPAAVGLWTAAILASVLLHELGHAATVRRFGGHVEAITIYALGGATLWREKDKPIRGWRSFMVSAAGSGVGLFAGLGLYLLTALGGLGNTARQLIETPWRVYLGTADRIGEYLVFAVGAFIWVSVVWGLVNWLPIGGLDGSKMLREVLIKLLGPSGDLHARIIGLIVGVAAAVWLWQRDLRIGAVLVLAFAGSDLFYYRRKRPPAAQPPAAPPGPPPPMFSAPPPAGDQVSPSDKETPEEPPGD